MLETTILDQVRSVFQHLEARYVFHITYHPGHEQAQELIGFLKDVASCSDKLSCRMSEIENPVLEFTLLKDDVETGIKFRGIPGGHEFTSLLLAVLNADGKGKNLPDEAIRRRIRALQGDISLQTYVSLTCTNCPDVVQALNIIALLNPHVTHEMVDGALNQEEVDALKIQAVPSVYANGKLLHVGRGSLGELLQKLEEAFGSAPQEDEAPIERDFDVLVLGGGPAGASAAIYSARKGLRVAIVAERIGGQVKETVGIENLISVPQTTGAELANALRTHIEHYPIEIFEERKIEKVELQGTEKSVSTVGGEMFHAPAVIIATGASWRKLNVEGEAEYIGRGVAFCPHCDGPFYQGKHVAVIGGGNSGIEAAIDLAGICKKSNHIRVCRYAESRPSVAGESPKSAKCGNLHLVADHKSRWKRGKCNFHPHQRPSYRRGTRLSLGWYLRANRSGSQQCPIPRQLGNDSGRGNQNRYFLPYDTSGSICRRRCVKCSL